MSEYHFISLLISGATAIATVLATVVALYLGLRNDRIKLKIKPARVDGDGNIPTANGSHFAVTNLGGLPQSKRSTNPTYRRALTRAILPTVAG